MNKTKDALIKAAALKDMREYREPVRTKCLQKARDIRSADAGEISFSEHNCSCSEAIHA